MKIKFKIAAAVAFLVCVTALGSLPATAAEHPAGPTCMDIKWNAEFLKNYPRAPVACQEIAVRDGKKFARFDGEVTAVAPDHVKVKFLNVVGQADREITIKPATNSRVEINGKKVKYSELKKGDKLTFWVPEAQLGVISDPEDTAASEIIMTQ